MNLRRARRDDLDALLDLLRDDALSSARPTDGDRPGAAAALEEILASPTAELWVADEDGRAVGTFQLDFLRRLSRGGARIMEIESVHVHSSRRGRGLGAEMLRSALARARERGCVRVQLTSQTRRVDAHRFYERLGFKPSHLGFKLDL